MATLSDAQLAHYQRDGFAVADAVFTADGCSEIVDLLAVLANDSSDQP